MTPDAEHAAGERGPIEVGLAGETDFAGWRRWSRSLLSAGVRPDGLVWRTTPGLFSKTPPPPAPVGETGPSLRVPARFLTTAEAVACHRDPRRFDLLYRLLWRSRAEPDVLGLATDPDVSRVARLAGDVRRATHKMKAFVRFRRAPRVEPETFVAWFEPAQRVVERTAPFFVDRFANLRFSILTPEIDFVWDGAEAHFGPASGRGAAPGEDAAEDDWRAYYRAIFNPARLKVRAMQAEMPRRYWRNLPEAALIAPLISQADARSDAMLAAEPTPTRRRFVPREPPPSESAARDEDAPSLAGMKERLDRCRRCGLWEHATQAVAGEGPAEPSMMIVGEQPGDREDLAGRPFVGPAGALLDRALAEAGVDRATAYVTNAVKHFKYEPRGRRRLHKTPSAGEVRACRWWLERETAALRPKVIVALGATAALSVMGRPTPVAASAGRRLSAPDGTPCRVTFHPAFILRAPDEASGQRAFADLVATLRAAGEDC